MPQILIPFDAAEAMTIAEAVRVAGRSDDTVRRWAQLHDLGRRIGGRWMISRYALKMYLDGDKSALREYLRGDRTGELVRPYMPRSTLTCADVA